VSKSSQICRISIAFALWEAQITNISPDKNAQKFGRVKEDVIKTPA
jgi:hypothetical protein